MPGFQTPPIPGFDPTTGLLALPWWAALVALLFVVALVAAVRGPAAAAVAGATRLALLIVVVWAAWTLSERFAEAERATERQSLEMRAAELQAAALAPGSSLACLDGMSGPATESACEQAVFATPQSIAAAISLTSARIALLVEGARAAPRRDRGAEAMLVGLRRALELDPFGVVAHVLTTQYGCSAEKCEPLGLLKDASRVRNNLREATFEGMLTRYAATGAGRSTRPQAAATENTAQAGPSPVPPGFNLPSADSIPPVSIMKPEPTSPQSSVRSFAPVEEAPSGTPRRAPTARTPPSRVQQADRPLQLTPAQ
jgi:hypothetical protein